MRAQRFSNQQIIEALQQTHGRIVTAAKLLGCSRDTIQKRIDSSEAVRNAITDAKRGIIEIAESNVYRRVESDDWEATKYLLDRQGKMNGWSPRQEVTGADGKDLLPETMNLVIDLEGLDAEQLRNYAKDLASATLAEADRWTSTGEHLADPERQKSGQADV